MTLLKGTGTALVAAMLVGGALAAQYAPPKWPGVSRAVLLQRDLEIPGREAFQIRVDFTPGSAASRHRHPGAEIVYVLTGTLEYRLDGAAPVTLKAGDALFIPAGVAHAVKNVGEGAASELGTYVVEKGKPLTVAAE